MSDGEDDLPLSTRARVAIAGNESDSDDDVPLSARVPGAATEKRVNMSNRNKPAHKRKSSDTEDDNSSDDKPIGSLIDISDRKSTTAGGSAKKKTKRADHEPWRAKRGAKQMWSTLEHNGVVFPPPYQAHGIPLVYDGHDVKLLPHEEEVATFFAVMKDTDYAQKDIFVKNFFDGFKKTLRGGPHGFIKDFKKCDFTKIYMWNLQERERKKSVSAEEKRKVKAEQAAAEEKYCWATIDGRRERVGNYKVEPPGLFRGRGEHPKMGRVKKRIMPEDIIINIGKGAKVPEPLPGHKWKQVIHNNTVTWLCGWNDTINTKDWKYVQFGATSSIKAESDIQKYEKARKLKLAVDAIRRDYFKNMKSGSVLEQQLAVTTYLVDKLALRAGGEKDDDLADTVGVCTLRVGHIDFLPPSTIKFDFLGKDSIRYLQEHEVDPLVFHAMQRFCKGKKKDQDIFDHIDPTKVNKHLQTLMPGLTIKVFRTYNASYTLNKLLKETTPAGDSTVPMKKAAYDAANKEVAVLCNHQKGVSKAHDAQMEKLQDKKKIIEKEIAALRRDKKDTNKAKIRTLKERLSKLELQMKMKDELKTVSLGTSKINYMDPRITIAWCKHNDVPPPTVYTKALVEKFNWAMEVEPDFDF